MNEHLYGINTGLIAAILLAFMLVAMEAGYRAGRRGSAPSDAAARDHINTIQSAILGILALLLGFTFSLSLQRYDTRSEAVVDEANAIGTAVLRAQLLPAPLRDEARALLRGYVDLRVQAGTLNMVEREPYEALLVKSAAAQDALWAVARKALAAENTHAAALFADSANALIDSFGKRDAALRHHVPEVVLVLLCATFLMAGAIVGFAAGSAGHRPSMVSYIMVALIVVLVFIILDLDRPRRGLVTVSQQPLVDLQSAMRRP